MHGWVALGCFGLLFCLDVFELLFKYLSAFLLHFFPGVFLGAVGVGAESWQGFGGWGCFLYSCWFGLGGWRSHTCLGRFKFFRGRRRWLGPWHAWESLVTTAQVFLCEFVHARLVILGLRVGFRGSPILHLELLELLARLAGFPVFVPHVRRHSFIYLDTYNSLRLNLRPLGRLNRF